MENDDRLLRRPVSVLVCACLVLITRHTARGTAASVTVKLLVSENSSSTNVPGKNATMPYASNNRTVVTVPTDRFFRTGSSPEASTANSTAASIAGTTTTAFVSTNAVSTPAPQVTALPISATAAPRSLRGPTSDGTDKATTTSYNDAFKELYEKYLADYEAYLEAYSSVYAQGHAAHPAFGGYFIPGGNTLPAVLPYFQTPPAGYPDFPYVFGYPLVFNGARIIM